MKKSLYLIAGILIGITLFGGTSVLAAGITAERSTNRIYVDGQEVHLTAYNINGNNYVMLLRRRQSGRLQCLLEQRCQMCTGRIEKAVHRRSAREVCGGKAVEQPAQTRCCRCKAGHR